MHIVTQGSSVFVLLFRKLCELYVSSSGLLTLLGFCEAAVVSAAACLYIFSYVLSCNKVPVLTAIYGFTVKLYPF